MAEIGHNSAGEKTRSYIERVERLEEEKRTIQEDIKEIYAEAKANGYDPKILRIIVRRRREDADERKEREALLESYLNSMGWAHLL